MSWLSESHTRFIVEPGISKARDGHLEISFHGVAPEIAVIIHGKGDIGVVINHHGGCWDILSEFDILPRRNSVGDHYCGFCLPGSKKFYRSRRELLTEHGFEPLLKWINENFQPSRWILLFGEEGHTTWAKIVKEEDVEPTKAREGLEAFVRAFPVIVRSPS